MVWQNSRKSDRRYDYDEVQEIIEGGEGDNKENFKVGLLGKRREDEVDP